MHSRRNRFGNDSRSLLESAPDSVGSLSKSKKHSGRSLAKKHQLMQYCLTFVVASLVFVYLYAISYLTDGPESQSATLNVYTEDVPITDWRKGSNKEGMTSEGQEKLRMQQQHVPKDLKELIPRMRYLKEMYPVVEKGKLTEKNVFKPHNKHNNVQLEKQHDKKGNVVYEPITSVKKEDLLDMGYDKAYIESLANITYEEAVKGRERLVNILHEAAINEIDPEVIAVLPKWSNVVRMYGEKPVVLGLERCAEFRAQADPIDASVGVAGMFNTGTNPMAMYISNNFKISSNKKDKAGGTRWQVPWGKHRLASTKLTNTAGHEKKTNKTNVLPVVLVRDPYSWMQSMCIHAYESRWPHSGKKCPNLAERELNADGTAKKVNLKVKYNPVIEFDSLADYWVQWYKEYLEADYPRLIIRFEDIQFHARELVETIAQCAGAEPRNADALFRYVVDTAKWGKAHSSKSNMISIMAKYGTDKNRFKGFKETDWLVAEEVFTPEIMDLFGYEMPKKLRDKARNE